MQMTHHHTLCKHRCKAQCHCGWTKIATHLECEWPARYLLASGSTYRAELLRRLNEPFFSCSPDIDESARPNETPAHLAGRLAQQKAQAIANNHIEARPENLIIIASDQVASTGTQLLGKPGTYDKARAQLRAMSEQSVTFHTALYMMPLDGVTSSASVEPYATMATTTAVFRKLADDEIERYLRRDEPLDCAGSFKVESLGISLFSSVTSADPTALIGLPMIAVCQGLRHFGMAVP